MLALTIRFLAGRYHATAWDHHVNEGLVEWPPSPWRLLRALTAASYRLNPPPDDETLTDLLQPLAETLPEYRVPPSSEGHTRHYMPLDNKGLPGDKSALILDSFVAPGSGADAEDGELVVLWPHVSLSAAATTLLAELCEHLGYLGRAESWVVMSPRSDERTASIEANCKPAVSVNETGVAVRLMATTPRAEHIAWFEAHGAARSKKSAPAPSSLLEVLRQDTGALRSAGWSSVPGSRWVSYHMRAPVLGVRVRRRGRRAPPSSVLFQLAATVLPKVTKTLQVGELLHRSLVEWSDDEDLGPDPIFVGMGAVEHAAICPLDVDGDGRLDHILVHFRGGFSDRALRTLQRRRRLFGGPRYPLTLSPVGAWAGDELEAIPNESLPPGLRASTTWRSATPFVLPRHPKRRRTGAPRLDAAGDWIEGPESQIRLELSRRAFPPPRQVAVLDELPGEGRPLAWHRFQRVRKHGGGARGGDRGYGFELQFDEPVRGPMYLGYARYFGLGQFIAI